MKILLSLILLSFTFVNIYGAKLIKKVTSPTIRVSFVDVGQGDSEVIQDLENHKVIIVDTGVKNSGIVEYLKSQKIKTIDLIIFTHPHSDHIGSGVQIINNFNVKRVLDSGFKHSSRTYLKLLEKIKEKNIPYIRGVIGQNIKFGKSRIHVLAPPKNYISGTRSDANSNSVVFLLTQNKFNVYFAADSEHETEEFILKNNSLSLKSDILKVAHHGSRYATSDDFLNRVKPTIAIISAGLNNSYHHPAPSTMEKLKNKGIKTYITFKVGTIIADSDGKSYSIKTIKTNNNKAHNSLDYIKEEDPDNYNEIMSNRKDTKNKSSNTFAKLDSNGKAIIQNGYFYASKNSKKFYAWNCKGLRRVKPSNLIEFKNFEMAAQKRTLAHSCKYKENFSKLSKTPKTTKTETENTSKGKININTASAQELISIKGIGKKTAEKIINYRKHNQFKTIKDIMKVKGIGKGKFRKLKALITTH